MQRLRIALSAAALCMALAAPAYADCGDPLTEATGRARGDASAAASILTAADQALAQGQFGEACVKYRLVLGLDRSNQGARVGLGEGALSEGDYAGARAHFAAVAQSAPDSARAHQGIGMSYLLAGDLAQASPSLRQAVALDPTLWRSWNGLGVIADAASDWAAADDAFQHASAAAPNEASIYNNLGMSRLQRGAPATAIESFDTALRLSPAMRTASDNRRIALAMTGQYDAALAGVSEGELAETLNNVAVVAARRGDRAVAERLFAAAITAAPRYYELAARNRDSLSGTH